MIVYISTSHIFDDNWKLWHMKAAMIQFFLPLVFKRTAFYSLSYFFILYSFQKVERRAKTWEFEICIVAFILTSISSAFIASCDCKLWLWVGNTKAKPPSMVNICMAKSMIMLTRICKYYAPDSSPCLLL